MTRVIRLRVVRHDPDGRYTIIRGLYPGSNTEIPPCVCVQQAYATAVRHQPQTGDVVILVDHTGTQLSEAPACPARPTDSTWTAHEHVHRYQVPLTTEQPI